MNFLQLVQRTKSEAGITGAAPTTLVAQVAEIGRVTDWVSASWLDIQNMHADWQFLRSNFTFNTTASNGSYTPAQALVNSGTGAALGNWKRDSFRKYLTTGGVSGEMYLPFLNYDSFRDVYLYGANRINYAPPAVFTVDPAKNIVLGNAPDTIYTVAGEYWSKPVTLALDADTPSMPDQFHMAIVWYALKHYGMYEAASESVARARMEYGKVMAQLAADQLPAPAWGAPLA